MQSLKPYVNHTLDQKLLIQAVTRALQNKFYEVVVKLLPDIPAEQRLNLLLITAEHETILHWSCQRVETTETQAIIEALSPPDRLTLITHHEPHKMLRSVLIICCENGWLSQVEVMINSLSSEDK